MTINCKTLALALVLFAAVTTAARADDLAAQLGLRPGECIRSGLMSTTCAPDTPRYFNRADRDQAKRIRSRQRY
jgi:hypothetical protein